MDLNERIRKVRKNAKLSQTEFGKKLGVSRSVIANIELDLNKTGVPDNIIKLICYSFKINEEWLLYGKGEMLSETSDDILQKLKNTYDLSNLEFAILEGYLKLDKTQRVAFENFLDTVITNKDDNYDEVNEASEEAVEIIGDNGEINAEKGNSKIG